MIKVTKVNEQKTPKDASTTPKPGMGKGKARGMGAAEFGGKFSGIY